MGELDNYSYIWLPSARELDNSSEILSVNVRVYSFLRRINGLSEVAYQDPPVKRVKIDYNELKSSVEKFQERQEYKKRCIVRCHNVKDELLDAVFEPERVRRMGGRRWLSQI